MAGLLGAVFPAPAGPFPPSQLSACPGYFCSSEGRKRHPQPLEDAVSAPARLRLLAAVRDPSVVG